MENPLNEIMEVSKLVSVGESRAGEGEAGGATRSVVSE